MHFVFPDECVTRSGFPALPFITQDGFCGVACSSEQKDPPTYVDLYKMEVRHPSVPVEDLCP